MGGVAIHQDLQPRLFSLMGGYHLTPAEAWLHRAFIVIVRICLVAAVMSLALWLSAFMKLPNRRTTEPLPTGPRPLAALITAVVLVVAAYALAQPTQRRLMDGTPVPAPQTQSPLDDNVFDDLEPAP
jgi:peptidoglycan/LPS O-acetylase OafA/YrhL